MCAYTILINATHRLYEMEVKLDTCFIKTGFELSVTLKNQAHYIYID